MAACLRKVMTAYLGASVYLLQFSFLMQVCDVPGVYTGPVAIFERDPLDGSWGNVADDPWLARAALSYRQLMTSQEKLNNRYQILQETELTEPEIVEDDAEEVAPLEDNSGDIDGITESEMSRVLPSGAENRPQPSPDSVVSWHDTSAVWWSDWQLPVFVVFFTVIGVLAITFVVLLWLKNQMVSSKQQTMSPTSEPGLCSPIGSSPSCRSPAGCQSPIAALIGPPLSASKSPPPGSAGGVFSFSPPEPQQWVVHPVIRPPLEPLDPASVQPQLASLLPEVMTRREEETRRHEPVRIRAKGLLERRGSSASLTIELVPSNHDSPNVVTPTKECSSEEYLLSAGNVLSRAQLRQCLRDTQALHREFWDLPSNHPESMSVAGCGTKNRYRTILPNERTRVRLRMSEGDDVQAEYINANYVRGYDGEEKAYIATQGPLPHTIADFWSLVWQENVPVIVMITKLYEQGRAKCEPYLPADVGGSVEYGDVRITLTDVLPRDSCVLRRLTLQSGEESRQLCHFWYDSWPDHKTPAGTRDLVALAREVETLRQEGVEKETNPDRPRGPVLVHCSAGIGRTGCFIAVSVGIRQLIEEDNVDILGIVCQMRYDRGGMIQTAEQYEFVHRALCLFEQSLPASE